MLEEEVGVMRNAMTTRAPCGANKAFHLIFIIVCQAAAVFELLLKYL